MKNNFVIGLLLISFFVSPLFVHAQSTQDLILQINSLLETIKNLQAQLVVLQKNQGVSTGVSTTPTNSQTSTSGSVCVSLVRDLFQSTRGDEVSKLQSFLLSKGYSYLEVTGYFGINTRRAVADWQLNNGVNATGFVGQQTRAAIKNTTCESVKIVVPTPITPPDVIKSNVTSGVEVIRPEAVIVPPIIITTDQVRQKLIDAIKNRQFVLTTNANAVVEFDLTGDGKILGDDVVHVRNFPTATSEMYEVIKTNMLQAVKNRQFTKIGDVNYVAELDINSNGLIQGDDVILVRNFLGQARISPAIVVDVSDNCRYEDSLFTTIGNVFVETREACLVKWDSFAFPASRVFFKNDLIKTYPNGSFTVSLDASSPVLQTVASGQTNITLANLKLRALREDITLHRLALQINSIDAIADLADGQVSVWDGLVRAGTGIFVFDRATSTVVFLQPIILTKDVDKILTIKGDIAPSSAINKTGHLIKVDYDGQAVVGRDVGTLGHGAVSSANITPSSLDDTQSAGIVIEDVVVSPVVSNEIVHAKLLSAVRNRQFTSTASPNFISEFDITSDGLIMSNDVILMRNYPVETEVNYSVIQSKLTSVIQSRIGLLTGQTNFITELDFDADGDIDTVDFTSLQNFLAQPRVNP